MMMMTSQMEKKTANRLWHTSARFIQFFERDLNRSIEASQALSTSSVDITELPSSLKETSDVSSLRLPVPQPVSLPAKSTHVLLLQCAIIHQK